MPPERLLRVLGIAGLVEWKLVKRTRWSTTWALDFDGDLEDFETC